MFTGIIEAMGTVIALKSEGSNLRVTIESDFTNELRVDQSLAHNGVCLTIVTTLGRQYEVIAIEETLQRSNFRRLQVGEKVNLERSLQMNGRLDGHIVQGHIDAVAKIRRITDCNGSHIVDFVYEDKKFLTVEKGSVCVNGVSLTVVDSRVNSFSVAIIPYTWEHTNFHSLKEGHPVNVEFDIVGKYIAKLVQA